MQPYARLHVFAHGCQARGVILRVEMSATPPPQTQTPMSTRSGGGVHPEFSVYVGNLDPDTSLQDMEELIYELFLQVRIKYKGDMI